MRQRIKESTTPSRILFLRVGIDLGTGKSLGPIFPDGTFEYVPIPEDDSAQASPRTVRFSDLPARSGGTLERFVPERLRTASAHYDPEFVTFTYGDPTVNKRRQLLRLRPNDILVFYAGLRPPGASGGAELYVIGFFTVKEVHDVNPGGPWPPAALRHLWANAHFRRKEPDEGLVVVAGCPEASRLLAKAALLSDKRQYILPEMEQLLGIRGSLKRAIGRWVDEQKVAAASVWISGL